MYFLSKVPSIPETGESPNVSCFPSPVNRPALKYTSISNFLPRHVCAALSQLRPQVGLIDQSPLTDRNSRYPLVDRLFALRILAVFEVNQIRIRSCSAISVQECAGVLLWCDAGAQLNKFGQLLYRLAISRTVGFKVRSTRLQSLGQRCAKLARCDGLPRYNRQGRSFSDLSGHFKGKFPIGSIQRIGPAHSISQPRTNSLETTLRNLEPPLRHRNPIGITALQGLDPAKSIAADLARDSRPAGLPRPRASGSSSRSTPRSEIAGHSGLGGARPVGPPDRGGSSSARNSSYAGINSRMIAGPLPRLEACRAGAVRALPQIWLRHRTAI
jgi:hypothetical protein